MPATFFALLMYLGLSTAGYHTLTVRLGDQTYMVRENASRTLLELGACGCEIDSVLNQAFRNGDAEVRWRVEAIQLTMYQERERRRKEYEERQAELKERFETGLNVLVDKMFDYYPYIDSLWFDRKTLVCNNDNPLRETIGRRYHDGGDTQMVFSKASFTDARTEPGERAYSYYRLASKRMAMEAISKGESPLTVNLLFQVMRVNDNLYLDKVQRPASTPVPEDIMPPVEDK